MLVQDLLQESARRLPDKIALICGPCALSYSQVEAMANRLAQALRAHGLGRGDRVLLYLGNSVEAVIGIFATLKAGGVFVPIHPSTKPDKLAHLLRHCGAAGLLAEWQLLRQDRLEELLDCIPFLKFKIGCGADRRQEAGSLPGWLDFDLLQEQFPASPPPLVNIDLDLACLIYTSGSTGEPKGVMCDHSNVVFVADAIVKYLGNVEADVVLNVLPLSFDYGLYQLLMVCHFGGTLVLERSFSFPAALLKTLQEKAVTGLPGVPTLFAMLLQLDLSGCELPQLRYLTNTGAALTPTHIQKLRRQFPNARLFSMYGLTETKRTLYLPPEHLEGRPHSVGIPIPGTEAWLEDATGTHLGRGEVGQLVVRGRHVMRGYWNAPEATAERFRAGPIPGERVCYTGDLFRTDSEGFFYFVRRQDDILKCRGEKVAPLEIEHVISELPDVYEVAVVGLPDPVLGQAIKACIVRQGESPTRTQVLAHCRARLEDHMIPKYIEFVSALPKTPSGKVDKLALAAGGSVNL